MLISYTRVSTDDQKLNLQQDALHDRVWGDVRSIWGWDRSLFRFDRILDIIVLELERMNKSCQSN